jgi:arsenate reductase (thioredoxin)
MKSNLRTGGGISSSPGVGGFALNASTRIGDRFSIVSQSRKIMKHILFIDVRNATRSQIAEAWLNHLADGHAEARSCGTMPSERVGRRAVEVMQEVGINLHTRHPRPISQYLMNWADIVVILGTGIFPRAFAPTFIWDFEDPTGKSIDEVRALREKIRRSVEGLIYEIREEERRRLELNQIVPNLIFHARV